MIEKKTPMSAESLDQKTSPVGEIEPRVNPPNTSSSPKAERKKSDERIIAIDDRPGFQTNSEKSQNDLLDLVESMRGRRILTGVFQGLERPETGFGQSYAVIYYGSYKVIIPVMEAVELPEKLNGHDPDYVLRYLVTKRLGAEVDFIVKGIDEQECIAVASRLEAMAIKRHLYYLGKNKDQMVEGNCVEGRVVSVVKGGIFVDIFGIECYIPITELSYQRASDAQELFYSGQRIPVKLVKINRSDPKNIKVRASVKQANENPYTKASQLYRVDNLYFGTVSYVNKNGIYVMLSEGVDCFCRHTSRGRPNKGARVTVRITDINPELRRISGIITHTMSV